ncbi:unnamed protein product [Owenia fusiformis]|uniref:Fucosyltransferase n=1 Tax=Owenia fusiformis TaxID=6347 RepID=A0A8S4P4D7_OWEFU|nr:unnamed protein product [Owenia fusiformis]
MPIKDKNHELSRIQSGVYENNINESPNLIEQDGIADDILQYEDSLDDMNTAEGHITKKQSEKLILLYNSFWDEKGWEVGLGKEPFKRLSCPVRNCKITDDKMLLSQSDAVVFHIQQLGKLPPVKNNHQKWVFFMLECPEWSKNYNYKSELWNRKFDWTMTYRTDSDIRLHYGQVDMVTSPVQQEVKNYTSIIESKMGDVAWIVSNCDTASRRDQYVKELQRYISVDVYGKCGNLTCRKDWRGSDKACLEMINKKYKFYIAFENSFCTDYVTEKFFKILPLDVVPVVRGGADYSRFAPEGSYIETSKFESPKDLASHLKYLIKNPDEYIKYLRIKERFKATAYFGPGKLPSWCDLCQKLHEDTTTGKSYKHIEDWWSRNHCHKPNDLDFLVK